jgi:predicted Na+-dependent transporter
MLERISRHEEFDLFIAWIAISLAFAIIFLRDIGRVDPVIALLFLGLSLFTVGIGFILHEMAHKFTAIKYGFWAEFRKDNIMLVVAVALAALV